MTWQAHARLGGISLLLLRRRLRRLARPLGRRRRGVPLRRGLGHARGRQRRPARHLGRREQARPGLPGQLVWSASGERIFTTSDRDQPSGIYAQVMTVISIDVASGEQSAVSSNLVGTPLLAGDLTGDRLAIAGVWRLAGTRTFTRRAERSTSTA